MKKISPYDLESLAQIASRHTMFCRSAAELVPWLFKFNESLICNKDSSLMASYEFFGPDGDSMNDDEAVQLVNNLVQSLSGLSRYPCALWWTVHRRRLAVYKTRPLPDSVSQMVDDERRRAFENEGNYVNRHFLTFTLRPNIGLDRFTGRVKHAMHHDNASTPAAIVHAVRGTFSSQYSFAYSAAELKAQVDAFEDLLYGFISSNPSLNCVRLTGPALGAFMHAAACPPSDYQKSVHIPHMPALDLAMVNGEVWPGEDFLYFYANGRRRFGIATSIPTQHDYWPDEVSPRTLDGLLKIAGEVTISHLFEISSRSKASRFIERIRNYHENRKLNKRAIIAAAMKGGETSTARENASRADAAKAAHADLGKAEMGLKVWGYYNLSVISYSPVFDDSKDATTFKEQTYEAYQCAVHTHRMVDEVMRAAQYTPLRETVGALSAWATTLPGMWRECVRRAFIDTEVLARLLPLRGVHRGETWNKHLTQETGEFCPALALFPTDYGTPLGFSGFLDDVGHLLLCGATGTGKTMFMALCATLFKKYPNACVLGFDMNLSLRIPTLLQGGEYLHFSANDPECDKDRIKINPLVLLGEPRHFEFLVDWLMCLASQRSYLPTAADCALIEQALRATRSIDPSAWRIRTIWDSLPHPSRIREELSIWAGNSALARYFDNVEDGFEASFGASNMVVAETATILKIDIVARPMLKYMFYRIHDLIQQRRAYGLIGPTVMLLPEVWHLTDHPQFADELNEMTVTWRKLLGCVWMDAQSPEQIANSRIAAAVRDNVHTRVFLPVKKATQSLYQAYQEYFGISAAQVLAIQACVPKRDYFVSQSNGFSRRIRVMLDPRTIAVLRSETQAQILLDKHMRSGNPNWKEAYIEEAVQRTQELKAMEEQGA